VIRDLAAALDAEDLDASPPEVARAREDVAVLGVLAEGEDRLVFEEEQRVGDLAGDPGVDEPPLERPRVAIGDPPEPRRGDGVECLIRVRRAPLTSPSMR
jgi:hypothetical protein